MRRTESLLRGTTLVVAVWALLFTAPPLAAAGKFQVLHRFDDSDGNSPNGGLILDANGNLYGTTYVGGDELSCPGNGCGVVFKLTP